MYVPAVLTYCTYLLHVCISTAVPTALTVPTRLLHLLLYLLNLLQYARTVVPGTYYCCIIPTEKKYPGMRRKYPGEDNNAPSPEKTHSIPNGNPKTRARKSAGRQTSPENPAFPGIPFFPGGRASHPREGAFPSPPRAELDCDACFFT